MRTEVFRVSGMSCAACSANIEKLCNSLDGVSSCNVNLTTERMTISYDETRLSKEELFSRVKGIGYALHELSEEKKEDNKIRPETKEAIDAFEEFIEACKITSISDFDKYAALLKKLSPEEEKELSFSSIRECGAEAQRKVRLCYPDLSCKGLPSGGPLFCLKNQHFQSRF